MATSASTLYDALEREVAKVVIGKERQLRLITAAILAQGHILLDDLPGVGKTTFVKTLALALGCDFKRIQFTPDLLPSDVVGMNVFDRATSAFKRLEGPVNTNLLLADELNRAIPRTQSALLEAMEERQVTLDGETTPLPAPFVVMATQNPVESESTFRLPAAQLDRFLVCLSMGYPSAEEEAQMLRLTGDAIPFDAVAAVTGPDQIEAIARDVHDVTVSDDLADYIVALCRATREHPNLRLGASPRASRALFRATKALAAISGRTYATPDDVHELAEPVLCHRLVESSAARAARTSTAQTLAQILDEVPVPPAKDKLFV